ncbi:MAG: hypothetical protein J7621_10265 [Niastella sp.]|nr:hypothetical protein [Niastella sp.]
MVQPSFSPINVTMSNLFRLAMFGMAVVYLVSCFTPLHIHFDSIRYYNIKDCIEYGCPPDSFAATDYLPYGYTGLLITLSKLGVLNAFSITFVNCLFVFAGLFFVYKIFVGKVHPFLFAVLALFNWTVIKFVTHPLSEMQYIFFSSASLYCFYLYTQKKSYLHLGLAFVFCLLTILTRTVGIALLPALVLGIVWEYRDQLKRVVQKNKLLIAGVVVVGIGGVVFSASKLKITDYTNLLKGPLEKGVGNFLGENLKNHFTELTEVFFNTPSSKLMGYLPGSLGTGLFVALGVILFGWVMYNTFSKRSSIPFYIRMYLLFYSIIILNWPYYDPRFWVPVLPLLVVVVLQTPFNSKPLIKGISRLYLAGYLALGLFAAAYSLYVGLNKERFAQKQASGVYRNEYETKFFGKPQSDTATHIDAEVLNILKKYD